METENLLSQLVRRLIEAENVAGPEGREAANSALSPGFLGITRSTGREQDRAGLLDAVEFPADPDLFRKLTGDADLVVWAAAELGFARSIVEVTRRSDPRSFVGRFRNSHVFERTGELWLCVSWQVTRLA